MKIEDFEKELLTSFQNFINTMKSHVEVGKRDDLTFADWFDTFRAYEEVGNDMEVEYHGQRVLDVHGPLCQLCASAVQSKCEVDRVRGILHWCSSVEQQFAPRLTVPRGREPKMISETFLATCIQHTRFLVNLLRVEE